MSLARSRTRSYAPSKTSDNARQFLPPSHYAAAATSPNIGVQPSTFESPAAGNYPALEAHYLDYVESPTTSSRPALTRRASMASIGRTVDKRRSQADALEYLLLPSLNDTIGRMTQPSSPTPIPNLNSEANRTRPPLPQPLSRSRLDNVPSAYDHSPVPSRHTPSLKQRPLLDDESRQNVSQSSPAPSHKSIRRVKSSIHQSAIPTRKGSGSESESARSARTPSKFKPSSAPTSSTEKPSRQRSATNATSPLPSRTIPPSRLVEPSPTRAQLARRKTAIQSASPGTRNSPRPFAQRLTKGEEDSSASEVEYEAEKLRRQKSRLFVTNAVVHPSSSESERDAKGATVAQGSRLPVFAARQPTISSNGGRKSAAVGLGIDVSDEESIRRPTLQSELAYADHELSDDTSRYGLPTQHHYEHASIPLHDTPPLPMIPPSDQDGNIYSDAESSHPVTRTDSIQRKRRTALLGLVDAIGDDEDKTYIHAYEDIVSVEVQAYAREMSNAERVQDAQVERLHDALRSGRRRANTLVEMVPSTMPWPETQSQPESYGEQSTPRPPPVPPLEQGCSEASDIAVISPMVPVNLSMESSSWPDAAPMKSPGRTAIKRESAVINMPARLRRYSVYGSTPEPPKSPMQEAFIPLSDTHAPDLSTIPHSESDQFSHAESDLLSLYSSQSARWEGNDDGFSSAAEALFKRFNLSAATNPRQDRLPAVVADAVELSSPLAMDTSTMSAASSASSIYDDQDLETSLPARDPARPTAMPAQELPAHLSSPVSERSHVIRDLFQVEKGYVERLQRALQIFITPLRPQGTKSWMAGVPSDVGRLFSWFEDIASLHAHITSALQSLLEMHDIAKERAGHVLCEFVPRFEVYQPYLVRVDAVVTILQRLLGDHESDFGEYIRIEEQHSQFQLIPSLLLPIEHLTRCMDIFWRLLAATPRTHCDYISTFSLVHSADMIIAVMREVKAREDEYDTVKSIASGIDGLPSLMKLAKRERRLLVNGELNWVASTCSLVHVFVFTDLLLLATPTSDQDKPWILCPELGVSRLLEAEENVDSPATLRCYVSTISAHELETGSVCSTAPVSVLELAFPETTPEEHRSDWRCALARCARHTVRSLSFPSHSGRYLAHGPSVDLEADTKGSVMAILASGLPLPKSPSIHIEEAARVPVADDQQLEREERGWWALRFQQVMREMQRQSGE